jgi:hypothetical protein
MTKKCTSVATHFKGLADAPVLCGVQRSMQHVQGYSRSHSSPLPGNYSLRIAPAAAKATANKATMKKCTIFAGHFDGCGGAPVQYCAHRPVEEVQGYVECHWLPPSGKYCGL